MILEESPLLSEIGPQAFEMLLPRHLSFFSTSRTAFHNEYNTLMSQTIVDPVEETVEQTDDVKKDDDTQRDKAQGASTQGTIAPDANDEDGEEEVGDDDPDFVVETPPVKGKGKGKARAKGKATSSAWKSLLPNPFSSANQRQLQQLCHTITRALCDETGGNPKVNDTLKGTTVEWALAKQGRAFTPSALKALPQLRMLKMISAHWPKMKSAHDTRLTGSSLAVMLLCADTIYQNFVRPVLRLNSFMDLRNRISFFLRDHAAPRRYGPGDPPRPNDISKNELVRCWPIWDHATLEKDLESVGTIGGLPRDAALADTVEERAKRKLASILFKDINAIASAIQSSLAAHYAVTLVESTSKSDISFRAASDELASSIRAPYELIMEVSGDLLRSVHANKRKFISRG